MTHKSWEDWMPRDGLGFIGRVVFQAFRGAAARSGSQLCSQIATGNQSTLSCWKSRKASHVWEDFVLEQRKLLAMALLTNFPPVHFSSLAAQSYKSYARKRWRLGELALLGKYPHEPSKHWGLSPVCLPWPVSVEQGWKVRAHFRMPK